MSDDRIEAAAKALHDYWSRGYPEAHWDDEAAQTRENYRKDVVVVLAAADAVDPLRRFDLVSGEDQK